MKTPTTPPPVPTPRRPPRGFRLPLGLVALLVLGATFLALVGPNFGPDFGNGSIRSGETIARTQMANFGAAIENYVLVNKHLPPDLETLTRTDAATPYPYIDKIPLDPWGTPYSYLPMEEEAFLLRSNGEDGRPGTEDDILWPRSDED